MPSSPAGSGVPLLVLAGVLWGTGGILGNLLAQDTGLSPLAVGAYRLTIGGGLMLGLLAVTRAARPRGGRAWTRVAVTGLLAAQFQACYFSAVALSSVSLATLVTIGTAPVLVLAAQRWTRGPVGRRLPLAVALAVVGLALLVGLPAGGAPGTGAVLAGSALAVAAGAGFATMTLVANRPVPGLEDAATTGFGFTIGGMVLIGAAAAAGTGVSVTPDPRTVALLAGLGIVPTALAYTCYFRGLRRAAPGTGAVLALLEPLTAAVLAAVLLGERLGMAGTAGAVLLGGAVLLAIGAPGRRPAAGASPAGGSSAAAVTER